MLVFLAGTARPGLGAEPVSGCDPAAVTALGAALRATPKAERAALLASRWAGLCRVDAWHDTTAALARSASPSEQRLVELQLVVGRAHLLPEVCADPSASLVFSQASKMSDANARPFLFERCRLGDLGFFDAAEYATAPGPVYLPLFAWLLLQNGGTSKASARPLVRAVAGLDP